METNTTEIVDTVLIEQDIAKSSASIYVTLAIVFAVIALVVIGGMIFFGASGLTPKTFFIFYFAALLSS